MVPQGKQSSVGRVPPHPDPPPQGGRGKKCLIIGLTGGIGMGKSTLAMQLKYLGAKTCNADDIVHRLMSRGGRAVTAIEKMFPGVVKDSAVDRRKLGEIVFTDRAKLHRLERLLHPMVAEQEKCFVMRQKRLGARVIVLDIPLLFETGAEKRCDITLVATAPYFVQRSRVLRRANMSEEKYRHILRAQMPDREKKKRADFVASTGLGKAYSFKQCRLMMKGIL